MASYNYTFQSGDGVTPTRLNDARTITDIVNADIKSDAAIAGTKIAPNFGSQNVATTGSVSSATLNVGGATAFTVITTNKSIAGGNPATSGSTDANVIARFIGGAVAMDIGGTAGGLQWIQPRIANDFSSNLGLSLCPNGGNVGIAKTNPATALDVNGTVTATNFSGPGSVPPGAIMPFAMNAQPSGWLQANGAAVSRSVYAALFAAIGTTYGAGDGSTTFNLPDLRGIFVRGSGEQTVGGTTYNKTFAAKEAHATGEHTHAISFGYVAAKPTTSAFTTGGGGTAINGAVAAGANEIANTTATSAGLATETRPANIALLYCIKF